MNAQNNQNAVENEEQQRSSANRERRKRLAPNAEDETQARLVKTMDPANDLLFPLTKNNKSNQTNIDYEPFYLINTSIKQ